jgi:hypothetical protein
VHGPAAAFNIYKARAPSNPQKRFGGFSQRATRVEDENRNLRTRLSSVEETLKQIQEGFLKKAEDQGKVEGNFGTGASKKRKRVEIEETDYRVVMEFGGKKFMIQHVCD